MELPWILLLYITLLASHKVTSLTPRLPSTVCAACRVAPATCALRSGLFTRAQLPAGMNLVATVPRGACNINVTEMAPSANHLALRTHRDLRFVLNGNKRGAREWPGDFPAAGAMFSYSRVTANGKGESLWSSGPINEPLDIMLMVKQFNPGIQYQYHLLASDEPVHHHEKAHLYESNEHHVNEDEEDGEEVLPLVPLGGDWPEHEVAWRVAGLTPCSKSCGGGEQESVLACMRGPHATLPPEHCDGLPQPEDVIMRCNTKPCPAQWEAGDWGSCSASCGQGVQIRPLICRQIISSSLIIKVADGACLGPPPERSRRCHLQACTSGTRWATSEWGPCSVHCGEGTRTRRVKCVGDKDTEVPDSRCSEYQKPRHEESCELAACSANTWLYTEWSLQCSSTCGAGVLTRRVRCSGGGDNSVVPEDEVCDPRIKPADSRPCHGDSGCGGAWFHGSWQPCPDQCDNDGKVYQERRVMCMQFVRGQFRTVLDSRCTGQEKPSIRRACPQQACSPTWFFSDWTPCTGGCHSGQRTREVRCLDQRLQPSYECVTSLKPLAVDKCNPEHCHASYKSGVTSDSPCAGDKLRNCVLVVQARLCQYPYYRRACCNACGKHKE